VAQQVAAIWVQLSSSLNPFLLPLGESTALSLRIVTVLPGNPASVKDYRLQGDLNITQAASSGATKTVRGFFLGTYVIDEQSSHNGGPLRFDVVATYDVNGNAVDIKISTASKNTVTFGVRIGWQGDPQNVRITVSYIFPPGEVTVPDVTIVNTLLTRNDQVLEAGQASHTAALSALDVIGAALKDDSFSDSASRLLFPPPPPPSSDLLVRATLDWVLFHRRRTKTCATETLTAIASTRRYQVFHLRVPDSASAGPIVSALLSNDSAVLQKAGFRPIDVVEFAAGGPALNTPASAIQTDWSVASPPPSEVYYAAIVSQGAAVADGNSLALQRLGRMQDAVSALSPPGADAKYEVLPIVPAALPAPGLDGDIMMITVPPIKFTGHRVLRTFLELPNVVKLITGIGVTQTVSQQQAQDLGLVQFQEHTSIPRTDDLDGIQAKWIAAGAGTVIDAAVIFDPSDTSDSTATRAGQSLAICKKLGTNTTPLQMPTKVSVEPLTSSITILHIQAPIPNRTVRLLIWRPSDAGAGRSILPLPGPVALEFKPDNTLVRRLKVDEVAALQKFGSTVRQLEFFTREAVPDAQVQERAKALGKELDSQGFKPSIVPTTGPLPATLSGLVPADAANAQDIVFIEVVDIVIG
jgi:hypothetical protein